MKTRFTILTALILLSIGFFLPQQASAQGAPDGVNYQAVVRNGLGLPLNNQPVNVRFSIHQGSQTGTVVFTETHPSATTSTNQFGLINLELGSVNNASFSAINWGTGGAYYLQIEVDAGSGFDDLGASQLLSVPYALFARSAATGAQGFNSLIDTVAATIAACPTGGYQVLTGLDTNANTVLDAGEITSSFVVCNGSTGSVNLGDTSATNEFQDLSFNVTNGNLLDISNGIGVPLATPGPTTNGQVLTWSNTNNRWEAQNPGTGGDDWGADSVNTIGGNILGSGKVTNPLMVIDNDTSATNEFQTLAFNSTDSNIIEITNGNGISLASNTPSANGQVLTWNGGSWVAQNPGTGADNWGTQFVIADGTTITGSGIAGDTLRGFDGDYNSLINQPTIPTYTAGTGINITGGNVINNTAPDQTVILTGAGATAISGSYPNFTITTPTGTDSQDLSLTGNNLSLTNDPTPVAIDLSTYLDNTDAQTLSFTSPILTINGGNNVNLSALAGTDNQDLSTTGNTINISGGVGTTICSVAPGLGEYLTWNGVNWVSANIPPGSDNQDLTLTGNNLSLTNDPTPVAIDLSTYLDNTDSQNLSITGNNLNISGGTGTTISTNVPSPNQVLTYVAGNWVAQTPTSGTITNVIGTAPIISTGGATPNISIAAGGINNGFLLNSDITITPGVGLTGGGTIPLGGTASIALANTTVAPGVYGTATQVPQISVDAQGRLVSVANVAISTPASLWMQGTGVIYNNSDNVGIGTPLPSYLFEVNQTLNTTTPMMAIINGNATGDGALRFTGGGTHYTIGSDASANMFKISNSSTGLGTSDRLVINNTGLVGIGTSAPVGKLDVLATGSIGVRVFNNSATSSTIYASNNAGGPSAIFWNGNVGMGTATMNSKLDVNGLITMRTGAMPNYIPVSNASGTMTWTDPLTIATADDGDWLRYFDGTNNYLFNDNTSYTRIMSPSTTSAMLYSNNNIFEIYANGGDRAMIVDATYMELGDVDGGQFGNKLIIDPEFNGNFQFLGGNVGIGTTTPGMVAGATDYLTISSSGPYAAGSIAALELKGNTNSGNSVAAKIDFLNGLGVLNTARIEVTTSASSTGEGRMLFYTNGGVLSEKMRITEDGNVGIGTTNPGTILEVNGGVTFTPATFAAGGGGGSVALTVGDRSYIRVTTTFGGSSLASISNGVKPGQYLVIENVGGYLFAIPDGQANLNIAGLNNLYTDDTITLIWTGSKWLEIARANN
jgi:hypothetical protein